MLFLKLILRLRIVALLCAVLFSIVARAYTVKGIIVDADGEPESYATVRVFSSTNPDKPVALGITDAEGMFSQTVGSTGEYVVTITSVGKSPLNIPFTVTAAAPDADLGEMVINGNDAMLDEVEIVATKPLVSKEIDRIGYDVQADEDSKTSTVQDILRKVPMVTVEADGTIKVKGGSNFKIYKDGHPSNSFTSNAKDIFQAIPASMIEKIEVITDPGAREDAEGVGAILNIVTVKQSSINGMMGNLRAGMMTHNPRPVGGVWLSGNVGKVVLSANAGVWHSSEGLSRGETTTDMTYLTTGNRQESKGSSSNHGDFVWYGIDGSYELDSLNLFTLEFGGHYHDFKSTSSNVSQFFDMNGDMFSQVESQMSSPKGRGLMFNGNFNYQHSTHRKGESITLSYQISNSNNDSQSATVYNYTGDKLSSIDDVNAYGHQHFVEHTAQVDWTRPFDMHNTLSVGGKFISRSNASRDTMIYTGIPDAFTDFSHLTTVGAAYADYRYTVGRVAARAGLRYEYSRLSAKYRDGSHDSFGSSLNDWVPNASVMYSINDNSSFKASYTTRINRPGIEYLNPTVNRTPTSQSSGNPDLTSVHYNSLALNYSLFTRKFNIDFNVSYDFTNHAIVSIETVDPVTDYITTTYQNAGRERSVDFSVFAQWSVTPKTSLMTNINGAYNYIKYPASNLSNHRWSVNVFFRATQQLPFKLRLEGMLFYGSGGLESVYTINSNGSRGIFHGFSLQRSFLKEDALTVKLECRNPFNSRYVGHSYQNRGDISSVTTATMPNMRIFGVSINFKFGRMTTTVKKTNAAISNDDLQGGASTPGQSAGGMSM